MADIVHKLELWEPIISEILAISGSPGLSLGVLHQGNVVHTAHFGLRDISEPLPPDDNTIYRIWSLTKPLTVGAVAALVEDGVLNWDTPIREYLPEFRQRKDEVGQKATLADLLSNRTGLAMTHNMWLQQYGEFALPKSEVVRMSCFIDIVRPFRKAFVYSNWNYGLVTEVIEKVTKKNFGLFIKERFLDPLAMQRSTIGIPDDENLAATHAVRNDGTPCKIPYFNYSDGTGLAGGGAGKSTITDLLLMYQSLISAYNHQVRTESTSTPGSPFKQMKKVFAPHVALGGSQIDRQGYCFGMYRTRLPGILGVASLNRLYLGSKGVPSSETNLPNVEIFHHTGNIPGGLGSAFLIPSVDSAVVVLTNSIGLTDPTDFVGQLIVSLLLGQEPNANYVHLSRVARQASVASYSLLSDTLIKHKTTKPPRHALSAYEGDYWNAAGNFVLSVSARAGGLVMTLQRKARVSYDLLPYDGDTFYWPVDREEELCRRAMFPAIYPSWHKVGFGTNLDGFVDHLRWGHDPMAKPEIFRKRMIAAQSSNCKTNQTQTTPPKIPTKL